jgi:SAM-dependent MidA family methyltransferase
MAHAPPPLDAEESARSLRLIERFRVEGGSSGFVPFDRFMELALYADGVGFYQRPRSPLGKEGDFYTATHVDPIFAASIAERFKTVRGALGAPGPFRIVELGPGDGTLAAGIVGALADSPVGVEYLLVERSSPRARQAEERVRSTGTSIPVRSVESVGALGPFVGVVVANEFLDAQPARRLRWDGKSWKELGIRVRDGLVVTDEEEMTRSVPGGPLPIPDHPDVVMELSPLAEGTVREIADHLSGGLAMLIDYGLEQTELLRGHSRGTLAAVRHHRFVSDPLENPGTTDLSTFVNFTRLRAAAAASGLVEVAFRSQAEALGAWGFPALLDAAVRSAGSSEAKVRLRLAAKNLLFGFDRFRVLELAAPASAERLLAPT